MFGVSHIIPLDGSSKKFGFAAGTFVTGGGATAAIVATNLTIIQHVYINAFSRAYGALKSGAATTNFKGMQLGYTRANGTPGSFYPYFTRIGASNAATRGAGAAATYNYLALGEYKIGQ